MSVTGDQAEDDLLGLTRLLGELPLEEMVAYASRDTVGDVRWLWLCLCARTLDNARRVYEGSPTREEL